MNINQRNFDNYLNKNYSFEKFPKVALAVSGGPDSMCLAHLLNNWLIKNNGTLFALIVDHKIREESYIESNKVKEYLVLNEIKTKILRVNKKNILKKNMNEARKNRFDKLFQFCQKKKIFHLFFGHHYEDNIETFFLRKIGGSNLQGLRGMQSKLIINKVQALRPLLECNKSDIINFNQKNNIFFVNDPSNFNINYSRVAVREFLLNNHKDKNDIIDEYKIIKEIFPYYLKMIYQVFNKINIQIGQNKLCIDSNLFFKLDIEIQSKIIEIIYKFLKPNSKFLRSKKILNSLNLIKKTSLVKLNLSGISIKNNGGSITFLN